MQTEPQSLALPYPYLLAYDIQSTPSHCDRKVYHLDLSTSKQPTKLPCELPETLHNEGLSFTEPAIDHYARKFPENDNTSWARAARAPASVIAWHEDNIPTTGQMWLATYAIFTLNPLLKTVRLSMDRLSAKHVIGELSAIGFPKRFWQGAGSPFGPRALWAPHGPFERHLRKRTMAFPPLVVDYTFTTLFPATKVHAQHPLRPCKPVPGSTIYSRYVPHLQEYFSMIALDHQNEEHINLFHKWQNTARVSRFWNESGSIEKHRQYLRRTHEDRHLISILGKFDDSFFAYFEIYWAKEDQLGAYYSAEDFDRGRHFLVGEEQFRGPHRATVWEAALTHYMFLDEPRTMLVVGEPNIANSSALKYDVATGYNVEKHVDLPHKRAAFISCSRTRFFQLCPFSWDEKAATANAYDRIARL
ncbi:MAG: hypothetical protein Q9214_001989 [Letrouitia sp. 1 TL-2023]